MVNYYYKYLKYKKKYLEIKKNIKGGASADLGFPSPPPLGDFGAIAELPSQAHVELNRIVAVLTSKDKIPTTISAEFFDNTVGSPDNILAFIKFGAFGFRFNGIDVFLSEGLFPTDFYYPIQSAYRNFLETSLMRDYTPGKQEKKIIRTEAWKIIAENEYYLGPYKLFCELVDSETTKFVGGQRLNLFLLYMYINEVITDEYNPEHNIIFKSVLELPPSDVDFTTKDFEGQNFHPDKITQWSEEIQQHLNMTQQFYLPHPTTIQTYKEVFYKAFNIENQGKTINQQLHDIFEKKNKVDFFTTLQKPSNIDWFSCYSKILTDAQIIEDARSVGFPTFGKIEKFIENNIAIFLKHPTIANLAEAGDFDKIKDMFLTFLNLKMSFIKDILPQVSTYEHLRNKLANEGFPIFTDTEIDTYFTNSGLTELEKLFKKIFISIYLLHNYKKDITRIATQSISVCQIYSQNGYKNEQEKNEKYKYVPLPIQKIMNYKNQNNRWTEEAGTQLQIFREKKDVAAEIFKTWNTYFSGIFGQYGIEWKNENLNKTAKKYPTLYIEGSRFFAKPSIGIPGYRFTQSRFYVPEIQIKDTNQTILELLLLNSYSKDFFDTWVEEEEEY